MLTTRVAVLLLFIGTVASAADQAPAKEAWLKEFDDACSRTDDAMTFTPEELTALIKRCDALRTQIEKLDETRKKIYTGRLRSCRGLYVYVLDSRKNDSRTADAQKPDSEKNRKD